MSKFEHLLTQAAGWSVASCLGSWAMEQVFVRPTYGRFQQELANAHRHQQAIFSELMRQGSKTRFGGGHGLHGTMPLVDFQQAVPVRPFEDLSKWVEQTISGESDVLWPGRTRWFGESSGTSGPRKQIPISPQAWQHGYITTAATYLAILMTRTHPQAFVKGKTLFFAGQMRPPGGKDAPLFGDITALSTYLLPWYLDFSRTPDKATALLPNWEERLIRTAQISLEQNVVHMAGAAPWLRRFGQTVLEMTGKRSLRQVWPNLLASTVGGVNPAPYLPDLNRLILGHTLGDNLGYQESGDPLIHSEVYNGTEGFYAMQIDEGDMVLLPNGGIFYEFVPKSEAAVGEFGGAVPLEGVTLGIEYAPVLSGFHGLWRYLLGDTVRFTAKDPYRLQVTGRISDSLNIAGEELLVAVTDRAMTRVCRALGLSLTDYTVTAQILDRQENARHLWLIELSNPDHVSAQQIAQRLDQAILAEGYDYAKARSQGSQSGYSLGLAEPEVVLLPPGTFVRWLHHQHKGRTGSQSKIPRLREDPSIAESILMMVP